MPEISRFFGIIIRMYIEDHNPPHFHAFYNEHKALFSIGPLELIEGELPPRIHGIVIEWASMHKGELLDNWNRLLKEQKPKKIKPLV
jgi:Domain of unknown function (DUF4160)